MRRALRPHQHVESDHDDQRDHARHEDVARKRQEPVRDVVLLERLQADEATPRRRRHVRRDARDQEPLRRPQHVVFRQAPCATKTLEERDLRVARELPQRVRDVGAAPGVAPRLLVVLPERALVAVRAHAVVADGEQDGLHVGLALQLEEALEEHVPVFGHHVHVPVADIVAHAHAQAVRRLREQHHVLAHQLRQVVDAAQAVLDAQRRRDVPDVVVVEDGALPERAVAPWVCREVVREGAEVAGMEERVRIAARHRHVVDVVAHLVAEELLRALRGPRLVRRLAGHLAGNAARMRRADHGEEAMAVSLRQRLVPRGGVGVGCFHRDHDEQLFARYLALGELADGGAELFDALLVGRDDDQVLDVVPREHIGLAAVAGERFRFVLVAPVDARRRLQRAISLDGVDARVDRTPCPVHVEDEQHGDERDRQPERAPDQERDEA